MNRALEVWKWIRKVELKYGINKIPIPDKHCDILISKLESILPELKRKGLEEYQYIFNDDFINRMSRKFYNDPDNRSMLFDFVKDLIHKNLLPNINIDGDEV